MDYYWCCLMAGIEYTFTKGDDLCVLLYFTVVPVLQCSIHTNNCLQHIKEIDYIDPCTCRMHTLQPMIPGPSVRQSDVESKDTYIKAHKPSSTQVPGAGMFVQQGDQNLHRH